MGVLGLLLFMTPLLHHSLTPPVYAAENLVPNGSFDNEKDLAFWQFQYDQKGESWYFDNHQLVSVVPVEAGRRRVLRLNVATQFLADNPGVKVDSQPIPVKPGGRYRLSAYAKSTGPDLRLLGEGYKWRPGVKPHDQPTIYELRKCYRFPLVFFGEVPGGTAGGLVRGAGWKRGAVEFPGTAQHELGERQQKLFDEVQFIVIHVVAIQGRTGDVFVDDIELERLNP
jgi:hypothetical protein